MILKQNKKQQQQTKKKKWKKKKSNQANKLWSEGLPVLLPHGGTSIAQYDEKQYETAGLQKQAMQ